MVNSRRHRVVLDLAIESLGKSGSLRFRVQGTSMLPAIRPGACVAVRQTAPEQIATGDIILRKAWAGLQLHRVVAIRRDSSGPVFVTRGDNHRHEDPPAGAVDLLGRMDGPVIEEPVPQRGRFTRFLRGLCA